VQTKSVYLLSIITSVLYFSIGGAVLVLMHPILFITARILGQKPLKFLMESTGSFLIHLLWITGTTIRYHDEKKPQLGRPLIIISNHQSLFDIPHLVLLFKAYRPRFVAKKELGNFFPSVSPALKFGGSILIDRDNQTQSAKQIMTLGRLISKDNSAAIIFPEGTRSRKKGVLDFKVAGVKALLKSAPDALIVPVCIQGNDELFRHSRFFISFRNRVDIYILDPIEPPHNNPEELILNIQHSINQFLNLKELK